MRRLAVLSMHTSPLAQPGTGDGGGMNVYVRELSAALARTGIACDVYTRREDLSSPEVVDVEPGLRVHHVLAGPPTAIPKGQLPHYVPAFARAVEADLVAHDEHERVDALHANYWLSGLAGWQLKERLGLPLVCTFHTLDRVKAEASPEELDPADPDRRAHAEAAVIAASDAVLASCEVEVDQLVELYRADRDRVRIIAPGVDHAFFSPGARAQARAALGLGGSPDAGAPLVLFVGRIQPLKGADVAVRALRALDEHGIVGARLLVVGGPSGPRGEEEMDRLRRLADELELGGRVRFVPPQRHELLSIYYRAADCCIVPSASESFGLVALEAGACATPVVASAVGGLTSLVEHGRTGYLVEPRDVEGFTTQLAAILSDPALASRLGSEAAERARRYTWSVAARRLRALYDELSGPERVASTRVAAPAGCGS